LESKFDEWPSQAQDDFINDERMQEEFLGAWEEFLKSSKECHSPSEREPPHSLLREWSVCRRLDHTHLGDAARYLCETRTRCRSPFPSIDWFTPWGPLTEGTEASEASLNATPDLSIMDYIEAPDPVHTQYVAREATATLLFQTTQNGLNTLWSVGRLPQRVSTSLLIKLLDAGARMSKLEARGALGTL